jgi:hypothetical protein
MSWHHIPKGDAWKQAHLAMLVRLGKRAWLQCDDCRHSIMFEPAELARQNRLDMLTPLRTGLPRLCPGILAGFPISQLQDEPRL